MKNITVNIKDLQTFLQFQGRSKGWLARMLGVTPKTVSVWFAEGNIPSTYIALISAVIGVPFKYFTVQA